MMCSYLPWYNNLCFGLGRLAYRFPRGKIADVFCRWKAEAWGKSRLLIHLNRVPCGGHGAIPIRPCLKMGVCHGISSGWWFQTWLEQISIIYGIILPVDFHSYFFRGVETTNQSYMSQSHPPNLKKNTTVVWSQIWAFEPFIQHGFCVLFGCLIWTGEGIIIYQWPVSGAVAHICMFLFSWLRYNHLAIYQFVVENAIQGGTPKYRYNRHKLNSYWLVVSNMFYFP